MVRFVIKNLVSHQDANIKPVIIKYILMLLRQFFLLLSTLCNALWREALLTSEQKKWDRRRWSGLGMDAVHKVIATNLHRKAESDFQNLVVWYSMQSHALT